MPYPCTDDPKEVISSVARIKTSASDFEDGLEEVLDAADENAGKLAKFVNGGVAETVQLGTGAPTPTLRNLSRLVKSAAATLDGSDASGKLSTASNGGTEFRTIEEHFGDTVNAKDFGAIGDGTEDDTASIEAAIAAADAQGVQTVYLPSGDYAVDLSSDQIARLRGEGVIVHVTGKRIGLTNPGTCDAAELRYFGELFNKRNSSPQAIGVYKSEEDGKTYFFMTTASYNYGDSDFNWAPGRGVFLSKYEFDPDSPMDASAVSLQPTSETDCDMRPVRYWNVLGLGHGGACEPAYINGRLHIFSSVFNGDGYTDILMTADESDIESVTHIQGAGDSMAQVAITPDASRIILCTNVSDKQRFSNNSFGQRYFSIYVYDRAEIEASLEDVSVSFTVGAKPLTANTPDLFRGNLSPSIAGTGDTVSLLGVKKFSGVQPLTRFTIPAAKAEGAVSGICSDGTYIYFLTSTGYAAYSRTHVMVFTIEGVYVKDINTDFMAGTLGERYLGGALSKGMYHPRSTEIEGIVCWNDQLLFGCKINCRSPEVYVKYRNRYFYLDKSFTSSDGYVHVEDETGDDYISCVDDNDEVVCYAKTGTNVVVDTDFIQIPSWTVSGTSIKNASNEVVAHFEQNVVFGVSPDQKPWVPTHKPTDLAPAEYDPAVSYSGTPEHYAQYPNIAHKYIVGVGCRKNTEHAYPLLADSFVQNKADYIKYPPAVLASRNGEPLWIGTYFERSERFVPIIQAMSDGSLWLRDAFGYLSSQYSPEYYKSARFRYSSSEDALRICVSNNYAHGAELKLEGAVSGDGSFELSPKNGQYHLSGAVEGELKWGGTTEQCRLFASGAGAVYGCGTDGSTAMQVKSEESVSFSVEGTKVLTLYSDHIVTRGGIYPAESGTWALGLGNRQWSTVYAASGSVSTSDARVKDVVGAPSEALMRAWGRVRFAVFQFKDAVAAKGSSARLHVGVVAQEVAEAFSSEGLDASRYGLFCHDEWNDEWEEGTVVDAPAVWEDGVEVEPERTHVERRLVQKAGDRYGIRYEEALALECAYQRWLGERRDAEIEALKARISAMEERQQ